MVLRQHGWKAVPSGKGDKGLKQTEVGGEARDGPDVGDTAGEGCMGRGDWLKGPWDLSFCSNHCVSNGMIQNQGSPRLSKDFLSGPRIKAIQSDIRAEFAARWARTTGKDDKSWKDMSDCLLPTRCRVWVRWSVLKPDQLLHTLPLSLQWPLWTKCLVTCWVHYKHITNGASCFLIASVTIISFRTGQVCFSLL